MIDIYGFELISIEDSITEINIDDYLSSNKKLNSIYNRNNILKRNAFLNDRMIIPSENSSKFKIMSKRYFDTAYTMLQLCLIDNFEKQSDLWIFPILYNIVHGIELCLKCIDVDLYAITNSAPKKTETNHDFDTLTESINQSLASLTNIIDENKRKKLQQAFNIVCSFRSDIFIHTQDINFLRYPTNSKHSPFFYAKRHKDVVVNIETLYINLLIVYNLLDYIYWEIKDYINENNSNTIIK